jgi:hypothetical protein
VTEKDLIWKPLLTGTALFLFSALWPHIKLLAVHAIWLLAAYRARCCSGRGDADKGEGGRMGGGGKGGGATDTGESLWRSQLRKHKKLLSWLQFFGTLSLADVVLVWLIRTILTVRVNVDGAVAHDVLTAELNNVTLIQQLLSARFNGSSLCNNVTGITSLIKTVWCSSLSISQCPLATNNVTGIASLIKTVWCSCVAENLHCRSVVGIHVVAAGFEVRHTCG